ncbi:hypothetical protein [Brevibacterium sp. ZH18]|uniref:hypothetical protein n=1 Tax=Brevibacterium sp. ZH18 TaxID=2927784 RepID=UPI001F616921|nr:hypothetical protein [Brevibacterium sp. ZH18]MCI4010311.1 hypothetical protein [Brevibacterium sp. ZH18]
MADTPRPPEPDDEQPPESLEQNALDDEQAELKKERLEKAMRKYRATLRNEAETTEGGFSADYYRSQKPPHW